MVDRIGPRSERFLTEQQRQVNIRNAENRRSTCVSRPTASPPGWLLDKIADEKLYGGYNPRSICPNCFIALTARGECSDGCGYSEAPTPRRPPKPKD